MNFIVDYVSLIKKKYVSPWPSYLQTVVNAEKLHVRPVWVVVKHLGTVVPVYIIHTVVLHDLAPIPHSPFSEMWQRY